MRVLAQAHAIEQAHAVLEAGLPAATEDLALRQREIADHGQVREQLEMLKHHADPRPESGQVGPAVADRDSIDDDLALLEWLEAVDALDERRLAGSGRAAHDHDLGFGDLGRAALEHLDRAVPFAQIADLDHRRHIHRTMATRRCSRRTQCEAASEITK